MQRTTPSEAFSIYPYYSYFIWTFFFLFIVAQRIKGYNKRQRYKSETYFSREYFLYKFRRFRLVQKYLLTLVNRLKPRRFFINMLIIVLILPSNLLRRVYHLPTLLWVIPLIYTI